MTILFPPLASEDLLSIPESAACPSLLRTEGEQTIQIRLDYLEKQGIQARGLLHPPRRTTRDGFLAQFTPAQFARCMGHYAEAFDQCVPHQQPNNTDVLPAHRNLLGALQTSPNQAPVPHLWGIHAEQIIRICRGEPHGYTSKPHACLRDALCILLACLAWPTTFPSESPLWHVFCATGCFGSHLRHCWPPPKVTVYVSLA